ncbi:MAG: hypothetical protein J6I76_18965 [Oribacterium sp.]|nr:hypothetical protein [Oribacterium sp.]
MEYEVFVKQFLDELQQNMAAQGVELHRQEVTKNNGVVKDGVAVRYADSPVAPTVYLDDLYEMHKDGYSVSNLVDTTAVNLEKHKNMAPEMPVLTTESAMENLYCVVVNTADNEEMLKNVPHEKLEDLSVVARFKVGNDGSFLVTNDICKTLRMTAEEVMEAAHANTERHKFTCQSMNEVLREIILGEGMHESYVDEILHTQGEQCPMWVLSNESKIDGAVAMASQDTLKEAHEKLGEDYYILPSSRHEVILVPQSMVSNVEDLKSMVHEVNITEVSETDRLSDSVYHFNGKHLSIADTVSETLSDSLSESVSRTHSHSH